MRLFRKRKEDSVQGRINELKQKRRSSNTSAGSSISADEMGLEPINDLSAEEQEFLNEMERNLKSGRSILRNSKTADQIRRSLIREHSAVRLDEEELEDEPDAFEAEREVESMVSEAQQRFVASAPEEDEYEVGYDDEDDADYGEEYEELASDKVRRRRQAEVEASYDDAGEMPHPPGTIVRLSDDTLGIIKEEIPDREYDLVYILTLDGKLEPRGTVFFQHNTERLGRLPQDQLKRLEKTMTWNRDHLIYYLDDVEMASYIPQTTTKAEPSTPARDVSQESSVPEAGPRELQRGRLIEINFGERSWTAVFWGDTERGAILAHNPANSDWELMQMNLQRFGDKVKFGDMLSPDEIKEIEKRIIERHSAGTE